MRIVGIIPARGGSKSIPKKNLLELGGHPLVSYCIAASELTPSIQETVVSTDSEEIADVCARYGAPVPFLRPAEISGDLSTDIEFVRHYLDFVAERGEDIPDLLVHLRPTTPLREIRVVEEAIAAMVRDESATALRSCEKTHLTPYKMFRREGNYMRPCLHSDLDPEFYNLPRQRFEDVFLPNGHVDVLRPRVLLETGLLHGPDIMLWETEPVADIDIVREYELAKKLLGEERFAPLRGYLNEAVS